jgi:hypothetical protein
MENAVVVRNLGELHLEYDCPNFPMSFFWVHHGSYIKKEEVNLLFLIIRKMLLLDELLEDYLSRNEGIAVAGILG